MLNLLLLYFSVCPLSIARVGKKKNFFFSVKDHIVNIFGWMGHMGSVETFPDKL